MFSDNIKALIANATYQTIDRDMERLADAAIAHNNMHLINEIVSKIDDISNEMSRKTGIDYTDSFDSNMGYLKCAVYSDMQGLNNDNDVSTFLTLVRYYCMYPWFKSDKTFFTLLRDTAIRDGKQQRLINGLNMLIAM